jgi:hypothetical protein
MITPGEFITDDELSTRLTLYRESLHGYDPGLMSHPHSRPALEEEG